MKLEPIGGNANDGLFRAENGTIYFRKYRDGKGEIFKSTRTKDLSLARKKRDELMAELWGEKPKVVRRKTVGELWPIWREGKLQAGKSKATMSSIDASWKNLEPYAHDKFPDEITEEWWLTIYVPQKRDETEVNPKTGKVRTKQNRKFMNERKWLVAFLRNLKRQDLLAKVPELVNPDPVRAKAKPFSDDEYERLLENADWSLMAKIVMGCEHFMRRSEVALMSKDRIDRVARTIHLRVEDTKIRKARTFPYSEALEWIFVILDAEAQKMGIQSPWLFPSPADPAKSILKDGFNRAWTTCKARARVSGKFHWLRHTGLTKAFRRQRLGAAQICFFAGLSLEEAQRTYLHFTTDDLRGVENLVGGK